MKFMKIALTSAALALAVPSVAQEAETSVENQAAIASALELGEQIYLHDQTAWHTTDAMIADLGDPAALGVAGWIINNVDDGHEAVFYRETDGGFEAVWSGEYDGRRVRRERTYEAGERVLTEGEVARIIARRAPFSVDTDYTLCSERLNQVVLPTGKPDGGLYVYLLAPQPAIDQIPFGGHFRFEVVDGEVVNHRKFANSCLTMASRSPEGDPLAAIMVSHLLDDTPTEIHVFSMYAARLPVYVMTIENNVVWSVEVENGEPVIREIDL